jgi:hypothetical protein
MGQFLEEEDILEDSETIVEAQFDVFLEGVIDQFSLHQDDQQSVERAEVVVNTLEEYGISEEFLLAVG